MWEQWAEWPTPPGSRRGVCAAQCSGAPNAAPYDSCCPMHVPIVLPIPPAPPAPPVPPAAAATRPRAVWRPR